MTGTRVILRHRSTAMAILAAIALVPACAEAQRAEGSFQRTLTVSGPLDIEVVTGSGRIDVRPGPAGRIEIAGRIQAHDDWGWRRRGPLSPEERVRRIEANPPIEQSGSVVRIGRLADEELREGVSISFTLTIPAASTVRSKTGSGSQHIEGVDASIEASSGSGSLTLKDVAGRVRASTGSGSITADTVRGAFHATAGSGSVRATGVGGPIIAKTSSGSIDVEQTGAGDVEVSSGSGSVQLRGVRGAVQASTSSGGLTIHGELSAAWRLSASSGSVSVSLPGSQGFELDANTGSGHIDVGFPVTVTGTVSRRSLRGSAQGGGPLLHVRTSSGGISIQKRT
jgi:putative adhesin